MLISLGEHLFAEAATIVCHSSGFVRGSIFLLYCRRHIRRLIRVFRYQVMHTLGNHLYLHACHAFISDIHAIIIIISNLFIFTPSSLDFFIERSYLSCVEVCRLHICRSTWKRCSQLPLLLSQTSRMRRGLASPRSRPFHSPRSNRSEAPSVPDADIEANIGSLVHFLEVPVAKPIANPNDVAISNIKPVASYNWKKARLPTIIVPGNSNYCLFVFSGSGTHY